MKCNNLVVYRDAKNGSKKRVAFMWFSPEEVLKGAKPPSEAVKCEGSVKVTGVKPHVVNDSEVGLDIHYACSVCKAPYFPSLPEDLEGLVDFLQLTIDSRE